jgi:hypothetical protein
MKEMPWCKSTHSAEKISPELSDPGLLKPLRFRQEIEGTGMKYPSGNLISEGITLPLKKDTGALKKKSGPVREGINLLNLHGKSFFQADQVTVFVQNQVAARRHHDYNNDADEESPGNFLFPVEEKYPCAQKVESGLNRGEQGNQLGTVDHQPKKQSPNRKKGDVDGQDNCNWFHNLLRIN